MPTNFYTTYDSGFFSTAAVHHEDLVDIVTILDSFQTPFFSTAPKIRARDVVHSWVVDTLSATSTAGQIEGIDFAASAVTVPARFFNTCQIFSKHVGVSDRERESNPAGIRDMYEHQIMKAFKEQARNFESRVFSTANTGTATGASGTAGRMAGLRGFALASSGSSSGSAATADIIALSQTMFENGAEPDSIWFAPVSKRQFITNTVGTGGANVRNIAATDQRLIANIDVFETPFKQLLAIIVDRFIPMSATSGLNGWLIGDRAMAKVAFFRPPQHKAMGKDGDHTRGIVLFDVTLQLDHPSAWGVFTGITG